MCVRLCRQSWALSVLVLAITLVGCGGGGPSTAGGPCLDEYDRVVGDTGIVVSGDTQSIDASLGYETINYCPGHAAHGRLGLEADGFFYSLDERAVDVAPGGRITLQAPGYPGGSLTATWSNQTSQVPPPPADLEEVGDTAWQLPAPDLIGVHRLDMKLEWAQGKATYAVLVVTDGSANSRITTTGPPRPGISTDEAPLEDAVPPELIFDEGKFRDVELADGRALLGDIAGIGALVFVCNGIQITAIDPTSPALAQLVEDVADEILAWQECIPASP